MLSLGLSRLDGRRIRAPRSGTSWFGSRSSRGYGVRSKVSPCALTVARPQHVCMPLSERRQQHPARSTCADAFGVRSSPLGDMLFMPGLLGLMPPTICCVRSQSVRDFVTEIPGGATLHRCGVAQSSSSELATPKLGPASPIVASWCSCMWAVFWLIAAHLHTVLKLSTSSFPPSTPRAGGQGANDVARS